MIQKLFRLVSVVFALALLVGCGPVTPVAPSPYVSSASVITPENIDQLQEIYRIGKGSVQRAILSPDGKIFAVTTVAGIYLYNTDTFTELKHLQGNSLQFSPDNKYFSIDTSLYDRATLEIVKTFEGQRIVFSPSGKTISTFPLRTEAPVTYNNDLHQMSDWNWQWFQASAIINDDGSKMVTSNGQDLNIWSKDEVTPIKVFQLQFTATPISLLDNDQFLLAYGGNHERNICDGAFTTVNVIDLEDGSIIFRQENCIYWSKPIYAESENSEKLILVLPDFSDPEGSANRPESYAAIISLNDKTYQEFRFEHKSYKDGMVALSPNGKILVLEDGGSVNFWKLDNTPFLDKTIQGINWVYFSPDSSKFIALTDNQELEIRETSTSKILCKIDGEGRSVSISYTADGKKALLWDDRYQELLLLDMNKCEVHQRMIWPISQGEMSFNSNGRLLAFPGLALPWIYNIQLQQFLDNKSNVIPAGNVRSVAFLSGSDRLIVGGENVTQNNNKRGFLYAWDVQSQNDVNLISLERGISSVQTLSNSMIITKEGYGQNRIWDNLLTNSKLFGKGNVLYDPRQNTLTSVDNGAAWTFGLPDYDYISYVSENIPAAIGPNGNYMIFGKGNWNLVIKDMGKDREISTWGMPECKSPLGGCDIKFDPSEKMVAVGTGNFVEFRSLYDGRLLYRIAEGNWIGMIFSPDGRWIATTNDDGTISLWGIPQP